MPAIPPMLMTVPIWCAIGGGDTLGISRCSILRSSKSSEGVMRVAGSIADKRRYHWVISAHQPSVAIADCHSFVAPTYASSRARFGGSTRTLQVFGGPLPRRRQQRAVSDLQGGAVPPVKWSYGTMPSVVFSASGVNTPSRRIAARVQSRANWSNASRSIVIRVIRCEAAHPNYPKCEG